MTRRQTSRGALHVAPGHPRREPQRRPCATTLGGQHVSAPRPHAHGYTWVTRKHTHTLALHCHRLLLPCGRDSQHHHSGRPGYCCSWRLLERENRGEGESNTWLKRLSLDMKGNIVTIDPLHLSSSLSSFFTFLYYHFSFYIH